MTEQQLRLEDFNKYQELRKQGHSIYCAINMVLAEEPCRCKDKKDVRQKKR